MQDFADRLVSGDSAGANQRGRRADARNKHLKTDAQPVQHHVAHRLLKRCAKIGDVGVAERRNFFRFQPQRRLQAG